jgi:aminoglycoside 2''-phosphotransferase
MNNLALFAMLPPFYDAPPHKNAKWYLERIEEEFKVTVEKYRYLKWAFDNDVFIINDKIVFRFPRTEKVRRDLKYELKFLNYVKDSFKVSIPRYSYISESDNFAGYKIISGKTLTAAVFKNLSKANKEKAIDQLIEFVNKFHKMSLAAFEKFEPAKRKDFIEDERRIEIELEEKLFPKLPKQEVTVIQNFYKESKEYLQNVHNICATHGDLYAYNILWNKDKSQIGVIDFSNILAGDPAKDFEVFYDYGKPYAEIAYEKYKGPKDSEFLKRGEIYYKVHSIYTLLSSLLGALIPFDFAHLRFKAKFGL